MEFKLTINSEAFKKSLNATGEKYEAAFAVGANMIASMLKTEIAADIRAAGKFGENYLSGLDVEVDGNKITTTLSSPGADLFEDGGEISGHPLLWIGISGTDAEGISAKDYGDQLFSVNRVAGGPPLLFSVKDRAPKYFGVPSVTIPKKFHIAEIQRKVMEDFPAIIQGALK